MEKKDRRLRSDDNHVGMEDMVESTKDWIKIEKKESGTLCWLQIKDQTNRSTSLRDASNFFPAHLFFLFLFLLSLFLSFFLLYLRLPEAFLLLVLSLSLLPFGSESTFQSFFFVLRRCLQVSGLGLTKSFNR